MNLRSLITIPIYIIGVSTLLLGAGWLFAPQPWLLDQRANELILQTSFDQLLAAEVNTNLGAYLTVIYRFFGWWVISIGVMVLSYAFATRLETRRSQNILYLALAFIVIVMFYLEVKFIPVSPFLWAAYGFAAMLLLSFGASVKASSKESSK